MLKFLYEGLIKSQYCHLIGFWILPPLQMKDSLITPRVGRGREKRGSVRFSELESNGKEARTAHVLEVTWKVLDILRLWN